MLYVRQDAYYNATPEGATKSRREQIVGRGDQLVKKKSNRDDDSDDTQVETEAIPVTVLERQEIPMPELIPGSEYLVAFLHSAGTATSTGMGLVGLSWQEIDAWRRCTGSVASTRDLKTVYTLSKVYANEYAVAGKKGAKPPYVPPVEDIEEVRELVSDTMDDLFAGLIAFQER